MFVVHDKHAVFLLTLANLERSLLVSVENSGEIRKYLCQFGLPNGVKYVMRWSRPNGAGNSRKVILSEIDNSLKHLGTDYIDLYIIHRWDYSTPIEETMKALNDVVRAGKARYIGASAMFAWQFQKARNVAEKHGWANFISMQNHLNLLYREEEREMMPYCIDAKIAMTPYSPLAAGRLARNWSETTKRFGEDQNAVMKYGATADVDKPIVDRVAEIAKKRSLTMIQVALA